MKVKELIEFLKKYDESREVYLRDSEWGEQELFNITETKYNGSGPLIVVLERYL